MAFKLVDKVKEVSTSTGTGNLTLGGVAPGDFQSFATAGYANGDTFHGSIKDQSGNTWETGFYTYTTGGIIVRTTPKSGSAALPVNFTSGSLYIYVTPIADWFANPVITGVIQGDGTGGVSIKGRTDGGVVPAGNRGAIALSNMPTTTANTVTITNATPCVVTHSISGLLLGQAVNFFNSGGSLPTGITGGQNYYAIPITSTTCWIATSIANAFAGTKVATSSAGSGTQFMNSSANLVSGVVSDICGLQVTGDYDFDSTANFNLVNSAVSTVISFGIGTSSATIATANNNSGGYFLENSTSTTNGTIAKSTSSKTINVNSATIVYLCGKATFSPGNVNLSGVLKGRIMS